MKALELIVKQAKFTREDWMDIAEKRRALISPRMDSFTLSKLTESEVIIPNFDYTTIADLRRHGKSVVLHLPETNSDRGDMQGLFSYYAGRPAARNAAEMIDGGCRLYTWGLSREGKWLLIRWDLMYEGEHGCWRELMLQRASVHVQEVDLNAMLTMAKIPPEEVCSALSWLVYRCERKRQELLEEARGVAYVFEQEDRILERMSHGFRSERRGKPPER